MLKQFVVIFCLVIIVSIASTAQEDPQKTTEKTQTMTEVKSEQPADSTSETEELVIWNKICPVEGGKVENDTEPVEYNGKLYGFCCPGCDSKFKKNPEKYIKNLNEDGTRFIGRK